MFIVRIVNKAQEVHDISFDSKIDAIDCYDKTNVDDSVKSVSVLEKSSNTVIRIKVNENKTIHELKDGDMVRLRPEYRTENESHYIFSVSDINENTERCSITCVNDKMTIPSTETVDIEAIKPV